MYVPFYVVAFGQALHAFRAVTKRHARAARVLKETRVPRRSLARCLAVRFVCYKWSTHSRVRHVVERATVIFICMDRAGGKGGVYQ